MFYSARVHLYLLLCVSDQNHMGYLTNQNAQVAMCNFPSVKDAADVAIATMRSGVQVGFWIGISIFLSIQLRVAVYGG